MFTPRKDRRLQIDSSRVVDILPSPRIHATSLGSGQLAEKEDTVLKFAPSPTKAEASSITTARSASSFLHDAAELQEPQSATRLLQRLISTDKLKDNLDHLTERISERLRTPPSFKRLSSSFIRVADLQISHQRANFTDEEECCPNFHHASCHPPPGMDVDPQEQWVALDDGAGSHAPIAPFAIAALAEFGYKTAMDKTMWKTEGKTDKLLKQSQPWKDLCWSKGSVKLPTTFSEGEEVLVWSGNFIHGLYGSDIPAVRSIGFVNMSPKAIKDLLVDSDRTHEYNKYSLGRRDLFRLSDNLDGSDGAFGKSLTKVMQSESHPPFVRRKLQFVTIMHVTELEEGSGYLIVSRAVTQGPEVAVLDTLRPEILMGVNVIRRIEGDDKRCLMINVNHIRTPMVPLFVGKRITLAAAPNFFRDLRAIS
jgi:hypothetical protein